MKRLLGFRPSRAVLVRLSLGAVLAVLIGGLYVSPIREQMTLENVRAAMAHLRSLWYGPLAFIFFYVLGAVLFFPASLFILAAALIWGWRLGGLYALVGGVTGAFVSFELSRYVVGELAWQLVERRAPRLTALLSKAGFRTLLTLRFVPLVPFPVFNYAAGLTGVRSRDFVFSTLLGIAIPTFIISYSADALFSGALTKEDAVQRLVIVSLLLAVLVLLPIIAQRLLGTRVAGPGVSS